MPPGIKPSFSEVKSVFDTRGYVLLEERYVNAHTKMRYVCPNHPEKETSIRFHDLKSGHGCPYCAGLARLTLEEARDVFRGRGYTLLAKEYINYKSKMEFECPNHKGMPNSINMADLSQGRGCRYCSRDANLGENNCGWKGGVSTISDYIRALIRAWRKRVKKTDGFKCVVTGEYSDSLVVHHLVSYSTIRDNILSEMGIDAKKKKNYYSIEVTDELARRINEAHTLDIGVTLKKDIHVLFHKMYGRKTTPEDFREFKKRYDSGEFKTNETEAV